MSYLPTRAECLETAGLVYGRALARILGSDPREAAELAHKPGGPSVGDLEKRIRAIQARHAEAMARTDAEACDKSVVVEANGDSGS